MNAPDIDRILAHFDRTADQYFSREEFIEKLRSGKPLRIKYGVDVRTPTLHIGHAVNLWLMRYMQDLGHKVVFVVGDFTTRIGDPDGRLETRPMMKSEDIAENIQSFIDQAKLVLRFDDPKLIEIRRNSEWYDKLSMREFIDLTSLITHARLLSRDTFRARIAHNREIYVHETLYPILQGYDSFTVGSDLAIIGSDQMFNESMGRLLQEKFGKPPQTLITTRITPGIDGRGKQSKSEGNYVGLLHSPRDKFGRIMSIPDDLIQAYFEVYTDLPPSEIGALDSLIHSKPRDAKMKLAELIVARYHGADVAREEAEWFEQTVSKGRVPDVIPTLAVQGPRIHALDLVALARYGKSRSDTRRLIKQGGVDLNGVKLKDPDEILVVKTNDILQVGRRNWFRIEISKPIRLETEKLWMEPVQLHEVDFLVKYVPAWELVKYLGVTPHKAPKIAEAKAREKLRDIIFRKDPKNEWLWKITPRNDPENIIGIGRCARDGKDAVEKVWLVPGLEGSDEVTREALMAMNDYAFFMLDFQSLVFKDAFAMATQPKSAEMLSHIFRSLDTQQLARDMPFGLSGFTLEGWQMLQDWRRAVNPSMFLGPSLQPGAPKPQPQPEPQATPAPVQPPPRPKPRVNAPKPPVLKPPGMIDETEE